MTNLIQLCWSGYYYSKNRWCNGNSNLTASNIKKGISIFGVSGSWEGNIVWLIKNGYIVWAGGVYNVSWDYDEDTGVSGDAAMVTNMEPTYSYGSSSTKEWRLIDCGYRNGNYRSTIAFANIIGTKVSYTGSSNNNIVINGTIAGDFFTYKRFRTIDYLVTVGSIKSRCYYTASGGTTAPEQAHCSISGTSPSTHGRWYGGAAPNAIGIMMAGSFSSGSFDFCAKNLWIETS